VSSTDATAGAFPEGPPEDSDEHLDFRQERIRVETPRHRIEGLMTLARDGYRSRVSDVLNASERDFVTLTDVLVEPLDGGPVESHSFLAVARAHIVFAVSLAEPPTAEAAERAAGEGPAIEPPAVERPAGEPPAAEFPPGSPQE
jgi:hypothetical protein